MAASSAPLRVSRNPPIATDKSHHLPDSKGFVNPWPSWVKPSLYELWSGLSWVEQGVNKPPPVSADDGQYELEVQKPAFGEVKPDQVRTWWLGHAGVMVEFPSSVKGAEPFRILFDPIFSIRCSPSQYWGPSRFYPAPCEVADLPPVHIVLISHNHYDHLDAGTISELWASNKDHIRFIVPLGVGSWMEALLGKEAKSRVSEMDWWDGARFWRGAPDEQYQDDLEADASTLAEEKEDESAPMTSKSVETLVPSSTLPSGVEHVEVVCTPAQHGSGRFALDSSCSLWASYTVFFRPSSDSTITKPFHLFFGGDTGYRLRPPPPAPAFPPCPAFLEMHEKYGVPDLMLLPISVGSSYAYLRSWDPIGALPHVNGGLTSQNHLDEYEALQVAKILCGQSVEGEDEADSGHILSKRHVPKRSVAIAIHFGTFTNPSDARRNLRNLRKMCDDHGWTYTREATSFASEQHESDGTFLVLNHGESVDIGM